MNQFPEATVILNFYDLRYQTSISIALQIPGRFQAIVKLFRTERLCRDLPSTGRVRSDTGNPRLDRSAKCNALWQQMSGFSSISGRIRLQQRQHGNPRARSIGSNRPASPVRGNLRCIIDDQSTVYSRRRRTRVLVR